MEIQFLNLPEHLKKPLTEAAPLLSFSISEKGVPVTVRQNETGPKIMADGRSVTLEYHKIPEFFRMLTMLPERMQSGGCYEEFPAQEDLCLMSDNSRNAVYNLEGAKRMIRYLALMGFNSFMLYTEDTYEVPEYPFIGYMRGRFSQEELKEIDDYAQIFGIEMIPCIQTLAHMNASIRWPAFNEVTDVSDILLVGEEKTYAMIDAMIKACRSCYRSRRIHIGMDEAHLLGSGKYLDRNGYRTRSAIILEHLDRVVKICEKYDFKPMIWSDMFFRIAFHTYYVDEGEISPEIIDMVPENLSLVYWDYYTTDEKRFRHMVYCHQQFHNPMVFAGGAWKWSGMAPLNHFSLYANDLHLKVCREEKVPMVIATAWGDDGAESSHFSVLPTLQQYAEYCYARGEDRDWVKKRFAQTFGVSFDDFMLLDTPTLLSDIDPHTRRCTTKALFYNDPLGGWIDCAVKPEYGAEYAEKTALFTSVPENNFSYLFQTSEALCRFLSLKTTLSLDIRTAYAAGDKAGLQKIAEERIPAALGALEEYLTAARAEWYHDNKTFGFDVVEIRIGGLKERLRTTERTLKQYLEGKIDRIEQLEEKLLEVQTASHWKLIASGNIM